MNMARVGGSVAGPSAVQMATSVPRTEMISADPVEESGGKSIGTNTVPVWLAAGRRVRDDVSRPGQRARSLARIS
jgi:hypothetical protein